MSIDVADWLSGLGLGQYAPAFAANDIDGEVLPELTADDLTGLGITSIGHRRKLLAAIAALRAEAPPTLRDPAATEPMPTPPFPGLIPGITGEGRVGGEAERRQLTVMFCDLVGSTPLSQRFDPEDLREIVGAYHRCVADTVGRFAGFVAKYMGDGVLVYFGYPEAHEDDAERGVRAGLAVIDAVSRLATPEPLNVRLGIASGLVVVGDLIGAGAAQERGVVGQTPNLAARLQALATSGTLVIADSTRRQIGALFEIEDLGPQNLAGFAEPQRAWRVVAESGVVSRFEALRSQATPLVGRDEELDLLQRRWQQAKAGEGRVVLVSGEPGIGKSRLTAALSERIESDPHARLHYFCSPHHQDSALYPFITRLEHAARFAREDTAEQKLGKLRELLAPGTPRDDEMALLAELLSLPNSAAELNLSPQRKREMLFEALLNQLGALTRTRPVLMVFEDAHWVDPTSHELLDLTLDRVRRLPVLLIVTFRPEFQQAWAGQPHVTMLALNRLGERDVTALVRGLAGNAPLGNEIVEEIVERTDGVPLFIEELTKAVLERADQDNRVAAVLSASPLPALAVPSTLHASLIARLDRIGAAAKEVGQIGAVIGREFGYDLIEEVARRPAAELQLGLDRLSEAGLLLRRGVAPQSSYLFKHALVQDAAYSTLLRSRRQELHARVAAVLKRHFADFVERQPELLAHHLTAAGDTERAVDQWLKAGQFAAERNAHLEAIGHFERGLAELVLLPPSGERDRQEIASQLARGLSLVTAKGLNSAEALEAFRRARDLSDQRTDTDHLFVALWNLWMTTSLRDIDAARPLSNKLLVLTQNNDDSALRLEAHHSAWFTRFYGGEPAAAHGHCDEGRSLYDFERHRSLALRYGGHDPGVCACQHGAWSEWLLGYPEKALTSINEAVRLATRLAHPLSLDIAYLYEAVLHLFRREPDRALQCADAAEALAAEQRLALNLEPNMLRGSALLEQGAVEQAVASMCEGLAVRQAVGWQLHQPYHLALHSQVRAEVVDHDGALAALADALAISEKSGQRWWQAEIHRLKGASLLSQKSLAEAEASFERSIQIARHQQAKSLELRAATSLARLWGERGRHAEAHELLAPVYGWFTEGFDTADLKDAKVLLDQLA
jgi:class 3 adenylate cyclase/predicted ATPase